MTKKQKNVDIYDKKIYYISVDLTDVAMVACKRQTVTACLSHAYGGMAQLVERRVRNAEATSSNLVTSTKSK